MKDRSSRNDLSPNSAPLSCICIIKKVVDCFLNKEATEEDLAFITRGEQFSFLK